MLFLAGGMIFIFGIISFAISNRQISLLDRVFNYHYDNHALNINSSAIDYAIREISANPSWTGGLASDNFLIGEVDLRVYTYNDWLSDPGSIPPNNVVSWDPYTLLLISQAEYGNRTAFSEVMLTNDSFSQYSYFTNYETTSGGQIAWFTNLDELWGPVHSNDKMHMFSTPTFHGRVTSTTDYEKWDSNSNPDFRADTDFNSDRIDMPTVEQLDNLRAAALDGGKRYSGDIEIRLLNGGNIQVKDWNAGPGANTEVFHIDTINGVISSGGVVEVEGKLNGRLTIHSDVNIRITGNIEYSDNPLDNPLSNDLLGLVSEGDVTIAQDAYRGKGGNRDLTIHASIMALNESFEVENYDTYGRSMGELNVLGGIIQERRKAVGRGRFTPGGVIIDSGFSKNYRYDDRLMRANPPFFPRQSFFTVAYWNEFVR